MEDDLGERRRQRRASAEFKELSKAEADGRNHGSQCRAAAEAMRRAARRLQLVPSTAKNAEGTNYRLDLGVADADALEAAAVASSIIAPKLDELREAVAKRGEDVKLALASAKAQSSSLTADAEARRSRLRGVVDDIKRLEDLAR